MRKRSQEETIENKKHKQDSITDKEQSTSIIPLNDINNSCDDLRGKMANDNLDDSLGAALMRVFERKEIIEKFTDIFTEKCKIMIEETTTITNAKIEKIEEDTSEHHSRICQLEKMADDAEQHRRGTNLILKGIKPTQTPKKSIASIITEKMSVETHEDEIKYAIKINSKHEDENTESYKFCLFDRKKRDIIYTNRMNLRNTRIYLSEDLTMNRSKLSYQTRIYAKTLKEASTWTIDGKIYLKDAEETAPRVIYTSADLKPRDKKDQ